MSTRGAPESKQSAWREDPRVMEKEAWSRKCRRWKQFCIDRANGVPNQTPQLRSQGTVYTYDELIAEGTRLLRDSPQLTQQTRNIEKKIAELQASPIFRGERAQPLLINSAGSPVAALEDRHPVEAANKLVNDSELEDSESDEQPDVSDDSDDSESYESQLVFYRSQYEINVGRPARGQYANDVGWLHKQIMIAAEEREDDDVFPGKMFF
jgi:hypothetical protein